jgi:hypothetical protein
MMKTAAPLFAAAIAALLAGPAFADPVTKTVTIDKPKYEITRTTVRDKEAGTFVRDTEATRKADGATATRHNERARTETGFTASGEATNFAGKTRSYDLTRTRTETGSTSVGSFTRPSGETFTTAGERNRTETGHTSSQSITNAAGAVVYDRDVSVSRANGQVNRSVDVSRAEGFRPPHRAQRPQRNHERRRRWNANH